MVSIMLTIFFKPLALKWESGMPIYIPLLLFE